MRRVTGRSSAGPSVEALAEDPPHFLFNRAPHGGEKEAELGAEMQFARQEREVTLDPGTGESQDVPVPLAAHAEALAEDLRNLLDPLARLGRWQGMRVADVDAGHSCVRGAGAHCDRRPG